MEPREVPFDPGAVVEASDGRVGTVDEVVVRPETGELVYLVVRRGWSDERLVLAAELVEQAQETDRMRVRLRVTRDEALRRGRDVPKDRAFSSHSSTGEEQRDGIGRTTGVGP